MYGAGQGGGAGAGVELVVAKMKLDTRPPIRWPGAGGAVSVDKRVVSKRSCRKGGGPATLLLSMLSALSAVARGIKATMALSDQKIVATAFIASVGGCRGLLPGDAGFTVRTFPRIPKVKTNILEYAQIWVERTRGVALLLKWEGVAGTIQTSGKTP